MSDGRVKRWLIPSAVGGVVFIATVAFFVAMGRVHTPPPSPTQAMAPPVVKIVAAEEGDPDERLLTDLEPLFLPTSVNTSVLDLPPQVRREPGSMSFTFPPILKTGEAAGGLKLPPFLAVPENAQQVLRLGNPPNPIPEFGRDDIPLPTFPERMAFVEVRTAGTGQIVFSESIPAKVEAPLSRTDWAPMEFMIAVDPAGLVGAPLVIRAGATEEIQEFFRVLLSRQMYLGARLPPGFYTVHVAP